MKQFRCIIVDDEPLARNVLEEYISLLPNLELVASCKNAGEAIAVLQQQKVELILCDIKMPGVNGLQFLKSLYNPPKMIVTTAYREYAVEGFDIGVVDYLLKPIPLERFLLAINRALDIDGLNKDTKPAEPEFMFFKTGTTTERIFLNNIDYVTAYGNYCKMHLIDSNRFWAVNYKISELDTMLRPKKFIRVHKSHLVNQSYIAKLSSTHLLVNKTEVPLSESYKKEVLEIIGNK